MQKETQEQYPEDQSLILLNAVRNRSIRQQNIYNYWVHSTNVH